MAEALYFIVLGALIAARPLRRVLLETTRFQRIAIGALFVGLLVGQLGGNSSDSYPFLSWRLYSANLEEASYHRYRGVRPDGVEEPVPIENFVRGHSHRFLGGLRLLALKVERAGDAPERERVWDRYRELLLSGIALYQGRHPERVWQEIRVFRCETDVPGFRRGEPERCVLLWQVDPMAGARRG